MLLSPHDLRPEDEEHRAQQAQAGPRVIGAGLLLEELDQERQQHRQRRHVPGEGHEDVAAAQQQRGKVVLMHLIRIYRYYITSYFETGEQ